MTEKLTLESPVVKETKQKYNTSRIGKKLSRLDISFEDFFYHFSKNDRWRKAGTLRNLTSNAVWYVEITFFREMFGKSRKERYRIAAPVRRKKLLSELAETLPRDAKVLRIRSRALRAGCRVELLTQATDERHVVPVHSYVGINGYVCGVYARSAKNPRLKIRRSALNLKAQVVEIGKRRVFVIPSEVISKKWFTDPKTNEVEILLTKTLSGHPTDRTARILKKYEGAWWVLDDSVKTP